MKPVGIVLVVVALLAPAPAFWSLAGQHDASAMFSQYIGSAALITMGITQLLATRMAGLERLFGGLDRIYVLHKWLGIGAIVAVLLHDTVDAEISTAGPETLLTDFAETLGELSLYGILVLVVITLATFVPYHLWKYTHKLMGAFFAASALHYMLIMRPFSLADPIGLYILAFCILGVVCYSYTLLPWRSVQGRKRYRVAAVGRDGDAIRIDLMPEGKGIKHRAGQFAFLSFDIAGLEETHPFTISRAPDRARLRFTIKPLGNYTHKLESRIKVGASARVSKPFGEFHRRKTSGVDVWIAGGIGVTPFVAWAGTFSDRDPETHLFYCVKHPDDAAHLRELRALALAKPNFNLHLVASHSRGRLNAGDICNIVGGDPEDMSVYFCGPEPMRESLYKGLTQKGLRASRFYYEEFEIRSGIGFRKLLAALQKRLGKQSPTQPQAGVAE